MSTAWSRGVLQRPIIQQGNINPLPVEMVRSNPRITKQTHFANFAADYLVGMSEATQPCGEECGTHTHRGAHEVFYVLAGTGTIEVDGHSYLLVQGDSIVVPVGVSHNPYGYGEVFALLCSRFIYFGILLV